MDELKPCPLELEEKIKLWAAINEYATACGGNTGRKTMGAEREKAVVACEQAMEQIVYNHRTAPENKPLTNREALLGTPEKIADMLLPLLPTMEGFCPYCNHWVNGACAVNPHWDCKNALVNWQNQPYARKPEQEDDNA